MQIDLRTILITIVLIVIGCEPPPRAPHMRRDDPLFQDDAEGIRFLAPEGWQQRVRGIAPPGKVDKERTLIEYRPAEGSSPTLLRLSLIDLAPEADIESVLVGSSYQVKKWTPNGMPEPTKVGSREGLRYTFTGQAGKGTLTKEVIAVRKGERVYFFTVLFEPKDTESRKQLRRIVESVIWKS